MIYSIKGRVGPIGANFAVIEAGGIGFKVFTHERGLSLFPGVGEEVLVFCRLEPRENAIELYGFLHETDLHFFELLISVSGVGPRSALAIMGVADLGELAAAIQEGRPDMLTRASGIGRKTAERIIVELKSKVQVAHSAATVKKMETDADILEALTGLGYRREDARVALIKVPSGISGMEERLKAALKNLSGNR